MDSLITVYHHKYLRKSTSSVIFFVDVLTLSTQGQFSNSLPSQIPTKKYPERRILCGLDFHFNIIAR